MCLLLDMGASARDTVSWPDPEDLSPAVPRLRDTVLSLAIAGASADMIRRLVDGGADIHANVHASACHGLFGGPVCEARDATVLHIGIFHFNAEGIQALFDHRGSEVSVAGMVLCRDDHGRILPLHWAAGSDYPEIFDLEACKGDDDNSESITSQAISTIKLLLAGNADTINARDASGDTPLRYAVRIYCGRRSIDRPWHYHIIKVLCESGADTRARDSKGQTLLHWLFRHHDEPQPLDAALITLLVGSGVNVYDVDARGRTAVHLAADGLRDVEAVGILLEQAGPRADEVLRAADAQGNMPLHIAAATGHVCDADTTEDRIRAQEEMMRALLPRARAGEGAGEGDTAELSLMDRRNAVGKTPRQLSQETRKQWRQDDEDEKARAAARGLGRGRGRATMPYKPNSPR